MAEIKAVSDPVEDPKKGKPRPQSDTQFPYYPLSDAVAVADALHNRAGGVCDREQLAAMLKHKSVRSGAFLSRIAAAKMFGLVDQGDDLKLRLTRRGKDIVAPAFPQRAALAKVDAFLDVELFRKVYEQFRGIGLPDEVGLKNLFEVDYGIVGSRIGPTVRVMLDSADDAGFFATTGNRSQMVKPVVGAGGNEHTPPLPADNPPADTSRHGGGGGGGNGGGGGQDTSGIDPAILGLLKRLPPAGTPLSAKRRKQFVDAFTHTVAFIYPEAEENGERPQTESLEA